MVAPRPAPHAQQEAPPTLLRAPTRPQAGPRPGPQGTPADAPRAPGACSPPPALPGQVPAASMLLPHTQELLTATSSGGLCDSDSLSGAFQGQGSRAPHTAARGALPQRWLLCRLQGELPLPGHLGALRGRTQQSLLWGPHASRETQTSSGSTEWAQGSGAQWAPAQPPGAPGDIVLLREGPGGRPRDALKVKGGGRPLVWWPRVQPLGLDNLGSGPGSATWQVCARGHGCSII